MKCSDQKTRQTSAICRPHKSSMTTSGLSRHTVQSRRQVPTAPWTPWRQCPWSRGRGRLEDICAGQSPWLHERQLAGIQSLCLQSPENRGKQQSDTNFVVCPWGEFLEKICLSFPRIFGQFFMRNNLHTHAFFCASFSKWHIPEKYLRGYTNFGYAIFFAQMSPHFVGQWESSI